MTQDIMYLSNYNESHHTIGHPPTNLHWVKSQVSTYQTALSHMTQDSTHLPKYTESHHTKQQLPNKVHWVTRCKTVST